MLKLSDIVQRTGKVVTDNSPLILTAIGVAGTITTAYLTGKATFRAAEILAANESYYSPLELRERVALVWKEYIPAGATALFTVVAIVGANRISARRAAALAAAYSVMERAFDEYRAKIVEKIGERKEQAARDEIAQETLNRNPMSQREVIVLNGDVLCYDAYAGRYFRSDVEKIRKAQNDINEQILHSNYASLSDLYQLIGLESTAVSEEVGWNTDKMLEIKFTTALTDDNKPCLVINFEVSPARQYFRFS